MKILALKLGSPSILIATDRGLIACKLWGHWWLLLWILLYWDNQATVAVTRLRMTVLVNCG